MTVSELIAELGKLDPNKQVGVQVGWAKDTAVADDGTIRVDDAGGEVVISGWLSDCTAQLWD